MNQALSGKDDGQVADTRSAGDGHARTYSESESESESEKYPLTPLPGGEGQGAPALPVGVAVVAARGKAPPVGIKAWLQACASAGEKPIPAEDPVLRYAQQARIPPEFIALHWREFKTRHAESGKRYADWRRTMLNSVRGNWYGLWLLQADGTCTLSTKGQQARRVQEALAAEEAPA